MDGGVIVSFGECNRNKYYSCHHQGRSYIALWVAPPNFVFFLSPTTILVIGYSPTKKLEPAPPIISKISS